MSSEKSPKHIHAQEHKLSYDYHFGGHWENKRGLKNISFLNSVRKRQQTLKWLLDFEWLLIPYDYLILTFRWFISAD